MGAKEAPGNSSHSPFFPPDPFVGSLLLRPGISRKVIRERCKESGWAAKNEPWCWWISLIDGKRGQESQSPCISLKVKCLSKGEERETVNELSVVRNQHILW